eukprot:c19157_g1_i2 orf=942-1562(+)
MGASQKGKSDHRSKQKKLAWVLCIAVVVIIIVIAAVIYYALFKPRDPRIAVQFVQLQSIYFGGFPETINTLNVTLVLGVWVHNPNRATFYFTNNRAFLYFYGAEVGFTSIASGSIDSQLSKDLSVSLTVDAPNYIGGPFLKADVEAGMIPLTTGLSLAGHVTTLGIFSHYGSTASLCTVNISLVMHNIIDYTCAYDVSIGEDNRNT